MTNGTALFVRDVSDLFAGTAYLYLIPGFGHIVASAAGTMDCGPEVYLFPSDENGHVLDWSELRGSQRGTLDIEAVMRDAGFTITGGPDADVLQEAPQRPELTS